MANFLTRLVMRHLGLIPVVQPLITPMFASEAVTLGSWGDEETGRRGDGESISGTGKMPLPPVEPSSADGIGVSPAQARNPNSELHISTQEDTQILRTGKMPIPPVEASSSDGLGVSPVQAMDASSSSQPSKLVPSPEQSNLFTDAISAISSEAMPIQQTPGNSVNRVQPLVEWVEEIQPNTFQPLDTNRSQNLPEMRSHLATSSEPQDSLPLTEPSSSPTAKVDTPQNPVANFIATPPTQPPAVPGVIQRQVDASLRSHSSIDSPINPPNLADSGGFVVEDISLEQPSPVKPTLPLVPPQAIPSVPPTTTNVPSRVEPLVNEVLETGQQRTNTQYGLEPTRLIPPSEDTRESSSPNLLPNLQGEDGGEEPEGQEQRLTQSYGDNTEVLERDRSTVQPNSQTSNLVQPHTPKETQPTPSVQASSASEMIQPLRSAESPISPPIQVPQNQTSPRPNSVQEVPNTAPGSQPSAISQGQNQGNAGNVNSPEFPLVRSETVLSIPPSTASKPSRVEPLINNDVASSVQPTQQPIELDLNLYHINTDKSINRQQNTPTSGSSEQVQGRIEGEMGRSLPEDSSSQPVPTVPSRTFTPQETSTGSNPPLRTPAQRGEFLQLVPQRSMSGSQSVPVSGVPDGETGRRGDGGKESVGSLTATGDKRLSEQSFVPQQNVDDPPKSPLKRGTLSSIVPPVNRETVSNTIPPMNRETGSSIVPPVNRETVSNIVPSVNRETGSSIVPPVNRETGSSIVPSVNRETGSNTVPLVKRETGSNTVPLVKRETVSNIVPPVKRETVSNIVPPFLRGARGDRAISSTIETPSESSSAMQVQIQSEKLSSLTRRSLWVLSQSSSRQSSVSPITNDVPEFPSSKPIHRRNPANIAPTTQSNSVETTPTIQISIGRIEVRASQPPTPPPRTKSTQRGPTQSLQDYLKQRQGGNS